MRLTRSLIYREANAPGLQSSGDVFSGVTSRASPSGNAFDKSGFGGCQENLEELEWLSQSPDLYPIEHLWDELEQRLCFHPGYSALHADRSVAASPWLLCPARRPEHVAAFTLFTLPCTPTERSCFTLSTLPCTPTERSCFTLSTLPCTPTERSCFTLSTLPCTPTERSCFTLSTPAPAGRPSVVAASPCLTLPCTPTEWRSCFTAVDSALHADRETCADAFHTTELSNVPSWSSTTLHLYVALENLEKTMCLSLKRSYTCDVCSVTLNSVAQYHAHLQGSKHQNKFGGGMLERGALMCDFDGSDFRRLVSSSPALEPWDSRLITKRHHSLPSSMLWLSLAWPTALALIRPKGVPPGPHKVGSMKWSRVSWSAEALRVPFTGTKGRSLTPEQQPPHTIIPPPPNLTLGTVQSDKYRSPGNHQTQTPPSDCQMEIVIGHSREHASTALESSGGALHHRIPRFALSLVMQGLDAAAQPWQPIP
ncbi:hypothetical protein NFI96_005816 [Prochilodus magdalenae]|nr:hypothetical protein NFI96_005816 [Prochilodus magdalenae]